MVAMVDSSDVLEALRGVFDPELGLDIVELGMVTDVEIDGSKVIVGIALTIAECPMRGQIEGDTTRKLMAIQGIEDVEIRTTAMTKSQRAELMAKARRRARQDAQPTMVQPTTRVLAIGSGKGGVGKSSVSVNLAVTIAQRGFKVGLLDADIWGFSIPRMLGITERLEADDQTRLMIPAVAHGIRAISTGLIVESEETALMWRGLMLSKALEQFLTQVEWGDLDYLIIDLPPGTGDIQMALSRLLPQAEIVVVTTPQQTAQKVAVRVADMARRSFMPIVGVVENMSGFTSGDGETHHLFGAGGGKELALSLGLPLLGQVPLDPYLVQAGDSGVPIVMSHPSSPAGAALGAITDRVLELVPPAAEETCTGRIARILDHLDVSQTDQAVVGD